MLQDTTERVACRVVPTTAPVDPAEMDAPHAAVEVVVLWGEASVLHVEHLTPPRPFTVGEASDAKGRSLTDFVIGADALGVERLPVVVATEPPATDPPLGESGRAREVAVVVPPGADAEVVRGAERVDFATLVARGEAHASAAMRGAYQYPLPAGATARIAYRGFTFVVTATTAARRVGTEGRAKFALQAGTWAAASFAAHAVLLSLFYAMPPRASALSLDGSEVDSRMAKYLIVPPEVDEEPPLASPDHGVVNDAEGAAGKAHDGQRGSLGKQDAPRTQRRLGIRGPRDNPDPQLAKEEVRELAREGGLIGILKRQVGSWDSPTSPYGRTTALGNDPMAALGALMGDVIGENGGHDGLDMIGPGRGGGGDGKGTIGTGDLATLGRDGEGDFGSGVGRLGGLPSRPGRVPDKVRGGMADVRGALAKEVIQREIRRHLAEVRFCYEQALVAQPDLAGRVSVKFIIAPTGAVQTVAVAHSDLGHVTTEQCIARAVRRWSFPSPEGGGVVVVTYPFVLAQVGR